MTIAPPALARRTMYVWEHPVLGRFDIRVDLSHGLELTLDLEEQRLKLTAPGGVEIRCPATLPDIVLREVSAKFTAKELKIKSIPDLGAFEQELLSFLLEETLLSGLDPAALLARATSKRGTVVLYESKLVRATVPVAARIHMTMNRERVKIDLTPAITLDFGRLLGNAEIGTLRWSFATAALSVELSGEPNLWARVVELVAPALSKSTFRRLLPKAMLAAGYDPGKDDLLGTHLTAIIARVSAGDRAEKVERSGEIAPGERVETRELPILAPPPVTVQRPPLRFEVEPGDYLEIERTGWGVYLRTLRGVYLTGGGRPWLKQFRVLSAHYDGNSGAVSVEAAPLMGDAARAGLAKALRQRFVDPVAGFFAKRARDSKGRAKIPIGRKVELRVPDGGYLARLDGMELSVKANPPLLVVARPRFVRFAVKRARYRFANRELKVDVGPGNWFSWLFVAKAKGEIRRQLAAYIASILPPSMQMDGYDVFRDARQAETLARLVRPEATKDE
ncbi:MAG: hypothetical protein KC635_23235 [Myxococcales bacterium]|nr:hypothetical protein [Myxococcales bacterium]MCB9732093.1 hypothetical protein [Deltaproteobacteria bacterium]